MNFAVSSKRNEGGMGIFTIIGVIVVVLFVAGYFGINLLR